jgi:prephenate dehydratase
MKIGFLGPEGTFCEEASKLYCKKLKGKNELMPFSTIHDLLYAVNKGKIKEGIVPVENSIEGTVGVVTDMLVKEVDLKIKEEIILPIYHNLIAPKEVTKLSEITDVISHPQALDQCKEFLRKKLPKAQLHLAYSTADAVKQVAMSLSERISLKGSHTYSRIFAAIGTKASAKLYRLKILAHRISAADNQTRFIVLSKSDSMPTGKDKTSIVFSTMRNVPGSLFGILGEFALRKINLTKIESRPSKKALGDYFFFVDMEGHRKNKAVSESLDEIKNKVSFLKVLGSYPKAKVRK